MKTNSLIVIFLLALMLGFQNCSGVEFTPAYIGEIIEGGKCVPGKKLSVFLNDGPQTYLGDIVSYTGALTAEANYNWIPASANPIVGPTPVGWEFHTFFYEGSDGLTLNFYANEFNGGSTLNHFDIDIVTSGNINRDKILFTDDPEGSGGPDPFHMTKQGNKNVYRGEFNYGLNTDGGIVGPFEGSAFQIIVTISNLGDINGARFYSADGGSFNLGRDAVRSFIIKYRDYEDCN